MAEMTGERRIGSMQLGGVGGKPAGDDYTGDRGDAGSERRCRAGRLDRPSAVDKATRFLPRRGEDQSRKRCRAGETGRIVDDPGNIAFEVQCVSPNELALALNLPDITEKSVGEALATSAAAKDHNVAAKKSGTRAELDHGLASQPAAIQQDGLRGQKFESRAGGDHQRLMNRRRRADRPVDLLRR